MTYYPPSAVHTYLNVMTNPLFLSRSHSLSLSPNFPLFNSLLQIVGRLAAQIAPIIRGKHKPTFCPNDDCGDIVVVVNADAVEFTGDKWKQKVGVKDVYIAVFTFVCCRYVFSWRFSINIYSFCCITTAVFVVRCHGRQHDDAVE